MQEVATDFREYKTGQAPPDWTPLFQDVNSVIQRAPTLPVDRNYLTVSEVEGSTGPAALQWDVIADSTYQSVLARIYQAAPGDGVTRPLLWLRAGGTLRSEDGLLIRYKPGEFGSHDVQFFVVVYDDGDAQDEFGIGGSSAFGSPGFMARFVLDGAPGSANLRFRFWDLSEEEPTEWDFDSIVELTHLVPAAGGFAIAAQEEAGDPQIDALAIAFE